MWIMFVLAVLTSITGAQYVLHQTSMAEVASSQGAPTALADNFFVYSNAVGRFVAAQPLGYTAPWAANSVPDASLSFPPWYVRDARWRNKVIGGTVTIYAAAPIAGVEFGDLLAQRTDFAFGAGTTAATREIVSAVHGPTGIFAPVGVPAAVPVFQVRLN